MTCKGWIASLCCLCLAVVLSGCPPLSEASKIRKTGVRMARLEQGATQYKREKYYFPGQAETAILGGNPGQLTGSQFLARVLFTPPNGKYPDDFPQSGYAEFKPDVLFTDGTRDNVISDGYPDPMPICYYPARVTERGLKQYVYEDNAVHTRGREGGEFYEFIRDANRLGEQPYKPDAFLLVAPGPDRRYFTDDDLTNWTR